MSLFTSNTNSCKVINVLEVNENVIHTSDKVIKRNIEKLDNSLERVSQLNGVTYFNILTKKQESGLIAQDVEQVLPEVVSTNSSGFKGVYYANMTGLIVESIKELNQNVKEDIRQLRNDYCQLHKDILEMKESMDVLKRYITGDQDVFL
jgi:SMC interacting uncharacterized protein involved in chromosome segregation